MVAATLEIKLIKRINPSIHKMRLMTVLTLILIRDRGKGKGSYTIQKKLVVFQRAR
jgi:hypothetical protein